MVSSGGFSHFTAAPENNKSTKQNEPFMLSNIERRIFEMLHSFRSLKITCLGVLSVVALYEVQGYIQRFRDPYPRIP